MQTHPEGVGKSAESGWCGHVYGCPAFCRCARDSICAGVQGEYTLPSSMSKGALFSPAVELIVVLEDGWFGVGASVLYHVYEEAHGQELL
jgi:hypothetical protein